MIENPEEKQAHAAPAATRPTSSATKEKKAPHPNRDKVEIIAGLAIGALIFLDWLLTWQLY